jgi:hypothetical protein
MPPFTLTRYLEVKHPEKGQALFSGLDVDRTPMSYISEIEVKGSSTEYTNEPYFLPASKVTRI